MPRASVIIPAYNAEDYIGETIDSILKQTFQDFEIIVVNDGSTDKTSDVVKSIKDPRIKLIEQANSGGPAKPRNVGIDASQGDYIFMFDSDDLMKEEKLAISIDAMDKSPDADLLFTNFCSINERGEVINPNFLKEYQTLWSILGPDIERRESRELVSKNIYPALVQVNFIGTSSVVLRRSSLSPNDRFNESLQNSDDRLFWLSFLKDHNAVYVNEVLHSYRVQKGSISTQDFSRRAPSKILALAIARDNCPHEELKQVFDKQISDDYASYSYALKRQGYHREQASSALRSLKVRLNLKAFKLFFHGVALTVLCQGGSK